MSAEPPPPPSPHPLLWLVLVVVLLFLIPMGIWLAFLLPGATTMVAWDCLSDLSCRFALAGRHQLHARPVDHQGGWALVMGVLLGSLGLLITGGISRTTLEFVWDEPPWYAVVPLMGLLLAIDVGLVMWLDTAL